jgi:hypothetical protein
MATMSLRIMTFSPSGTRCDPDGRPSSNPVAVVHFVRPRDNKNCSGKKNIQITNATVSDK